ncbi:MAG: hypothetical protein A3F16_07680 [Deltaproteobacteria bacterium RIFCSPHIGHO2_12_FULL_43_9]|nr:MAG: hypothetical protein A3F16_07680 [Deltaproteobacteria bacterium RIFCSPHIGHO2_12_FULL_43_9]
MIFGQKINLIKGENVELLFTLFESQIPHKKQSVTLSTNFTRNNALVQFFDSPIFYNILNLLKKNAGIAFALQKDKGRNALVPPHSARSSFR